MLHRHQHCFHESLKCLLLQLGKFTTRVEWRTWLEISTVQSSVNCFENRAGVCAHCAGQQPVTWARRRQSKAVPMVTSQILASRLRDNSSGKWNLARSQQWNLVTSLNCYLSGVDADGKSYSWFYQAHRQQECVCWNIRFRQHRHLKNSCWCDWSNLSPSAK